MGLKSQTEHILEEKVKQRVTETRPRESEGAYEFVDDCGNVSLSPPPPYFPSKLHGHLAALAETTGVFPLGLFVCLTTGSHWSSSQFHFLSVFHPLWPFVR